MKSILIPKLNNSSNKYDPTLLENLEYGIYDGSHIDIANKLRDKKIFTITTIIDRLNPKFWKNKNTLKKLKEN